MPIKKGLLLTVAFLMVCTFEAGALTWKEATSLAERNSHEIISARKQLESTEWSYREAFSVYLPHLSASASRSNSAYSYGLSASQNLFTGLSGIYSIQSSFADVEYQKSNLMAARASFFYDLRSAFIEVLVAQENIKLLEKILSQRKDNSRLIELRYQSGKEDQGNLMTTQADEAQAEYDLSSAKRDLKLARLKLSQLLGREVATVEETEKPKSEGSADFDNLLLTSPSYLMAKQQLVAAEISLKSTISDFLPSLSLSGSLSRTGSTWPPETDNKSWSLSLSYSFFPGGSNFASRAIAASQLDKAKEDFASTALDLRYSLEEAYDDLQNAREALSVAEVSLAASAKRSQITQAKYLNGLVAYDEWNRIENTNIQSQKTLLSRNRSVLLAEALWHKTYGGWVK